VLYLRDLKCGIGIYNCATGGNDFTNAFGCGAAAIDLATGDFLGGGVGASGCAGWIFCDDKPVVRSCDPNEIKGPTGYGVDRYIAKKDEMEYTIFFENDSAFATTAAQRVTVRQKIHPNMNPLSLKLEEFGFGKYIFQIPGNPPNYTTTLLLEDSADIGVDVQFTAGIDIVNNELFFIFQSIDRTTGVAPYDPLSGFLKVNDSIGSGEGFVKYSIKPSASTVTGDSITAVADIVFDINSIITTNTEFNIIDAVAPTSTLDGLPPTVDSTSFWITWNAVDDPGGSGVGSYALFASENGGSWVQEALLGPDTAYKFSGNNLSRYDFFIQAFDNVGNKEALKNVSETFTVINASDLRFVSPTDTMTYCAGDSIDLIWNPGGVNYVNLSYTVDSGQTYIPIASQVDSMAIPYQWAIPGNLTTGKYVFRVSDTADVFYSYSDSIGIGSPPNISITVDQAICLNDTIQLQATGGETYSWSPAEGLSNVSVPNPMAYPDSSTIYTVTVADEFGCTAQQTVIINVNYSDTVYTFANTCDSSAAGVFNTVLVNKNSCDSVIIHTVTIRPSHETILGTNVICQGDSSQIFGEYRSAAGTYRDTLQTVYGCDSVLVQYLQVDPTYATNLGDYNICQGDSVLFAGEYRSTPGVYTDSLAAITGCDSLVSVEVKVNPVYNQTAQLFICQGDSAYLGGAYQTAAGTYVDNLQTISGCDSNITTTLTVGITNQTNETATICQGDSIFLAGAYRTSAGTFVDSLVNTSGCDSIVNTQLTVNASYAFNNSLSICQGDSAFIAGAYRTQSGTYTDYLQTVTGCDSTISTTLTVDPIQYTQSNLSICAGDSALIGTSYQKVSGSYPVTYTAASTCDSIHTTVLTVFPNKVGSDNASICQGDSIYLGGAYQTTAGTYVDVLTAANGCDSVLTTTLAVNLPVSANDQQSICQGDSIYLGGAYQTTAGNYVDVFVATNGCDSTVTTALTVLPTSTGNGFATICQGDSILLGGSYQTIAGNYVDVYQAANGCDSLHTTTLTVIPSYSITDNASICQGDSIYLGGAFQTTSGSYVDVYQAANGCDSTVTTVLAVIPPVAVSDNATICQGDSILLGGSYQTTSGTYVDVYQAANGCDSVVTTTLTVVPAVSGTSSITICRGDSVLLGGSYQTVSGSYVDTLQSAAGCDSILTTSLTVFQVDTGVTVVNNVLTANATNASYRWLDCTTNSYIPGETGQSFTPTANGLYAVEVTQSGCVDTSSCRAITDIGMEEMSIPDLTYRPNPTAGAVYIDLAREYRSVEVFVVSSSGQLVETYSFENASHITIDLSNYTAAEYFLKVVADDKQQILKIVKRN
jgi:hypothetical protein